MKYKLGELIESVSKTYDFSNKDSIIFVNTSDIFDGVITGKETKINELPGQAKKSIKHNDILFSEIRPKNKRFAMVTDIEPSNYVVSTKLMVLRNKKEKVLDTKYLYLYLTSPTIISYLQSEAESRSGTFPQITFKDNVSNIEINLPSLYEQHEVVRKIGTIINKIKLNKQINANLTNQLNSMFDKMYYESSSRIKLMNFVSEMKSGDWGKAKLTDNFIKPAVIIRGTDFCNVANGQKSDAPIRYLKTATIQKKHLIANDVLIEISGGSPTQSTGRSLLITDKLLNRYNTPVLGTNFTRLFRCETEENAVLFHSYINFLYNKNVFFNYENGTTGIKNLDYKSILKINVNDVQKHSLFPKYFSMYHFYESMKQHLGDESTVLTCLKEQLLRKFF